MTLTGDSSPFDREVRLADPQRLSPGFLSHCLKKGWIVAEGEGRNTEYYITEKGRSELKRFEIQV